MKLKRMHIAFAVVAVLAVIAIGAFLWITSPPTLVEYSDPVSVEERSQNTGLMAALFSGGINDSLVDIDAERTYVAYALPGGTDADTMQRFVVGAAANAAPDTGKIVALQYVNDIPSVVWTVQLADFKAFMRGEITESQLDAKIEKKAL